MSIISRKMLFGLSIATVLCGTAGAALAGGFAIREQSTTGQGASFAGNAAGNDLSGIFWNPAIVGNAGAGLTTESHYAYIIPDASIDPDDNLAIPFGLFDNGATDIGKDALVPASYAAFRLTDKLTIGYGFNAPFGLSTEPDNTNYAGVLEARKSALKTLNFNPVIGYQITPTLNVGIGLQVMYSELKLKLGDPNPLLGGIRNLEGDDWSYGFTAGLLWKPVAGTSIGVGYRSRMDQDLEGSLDFDVTGLTLPDQAIKADGFNLPDILTISLRQDISSNMRLLGTFEWSNWSVLGDVFISNRDTGAALLSFSPRWDDGYFLSGGLEYDYNEKLTVRTGVAYEWSPVQEPEQRLLSIPDTNRLWLSVGATYNWSAKTSFDIAYTHIIGEEERISTAAGFLGSAEADVNIISLSYRTKWGKEGPFGLLKGLTD